MQGDRRPIQRRFRRIAETLRRGDPPRSARRRELVWSRARVRCPEGIQRRDGGLHRSDPPQSARFSRVRHPRVRLHVARSARASDHRLHRSHSPESQRRSRLQSARDRLCAALARESDKAIADATSCLQIEPHLAAAYTTRAWAYTYKRDADHCLADANEAIRLDPTSPKSYRCRGRAYLLKREALKALPDFDEAVRLAPDDAFCYADRAAAQRQAPRHYRPIRSPRLRHGHSPETECRVDLSGPRLDLHLRPRLRQRLHEFHHRRGTRSDRRRCTRRFERCLWRKTSRSRASDSRSHASHPARSRVAGVVFLSRNRFYVAMQGNYDRSIGDLERVDPVGSRGRLALFPTRGEVLFRKT